MLHLLISWDTLQRRLWPALLCWLLVNIEHTKASCSMLNDCNGHGTCEPTTKTCSCFEGYGHANDVTLYRAPDCSARTCPSGPAWADVPTSATTAHAVAECSNKGKCDRITGKCDCDAGFTGDACQRTACPNDCSGHGRCVSMRNMAKMTDALPLSAPTTYEGAHTSITWDQDMIYGCVCDSSWSVGLGSGETQVPEWHGPDCSLRHCPSGNDPVTAIDETDCEGVTAEGGFGVGEAGNRCHVECSNRGTCDFSTGQCTCFPGYSGENCDTRNPLYSSH